jgi:type IV secretion system protein VirB4
MKGRAELHATANAQIPVANHIPFGTHLKEDVVQLARTGDYLATWRLGGVSFETASLEDLSSAKEGLCNFLRSLGGGHFALWTHRVRRNVKERLQGQYTQAFARELDERYYRSFDSVKQMATEWYVTVIYRPTPSRTMRLFKRVAVRTPEEIKARQSEGLDVMDDIAKQFQAAMAKYGPERLTTYRVGNIVCSQMLSFFGFLVNGVWEDIPLKTARIAEYLPTSRLHFGDRNGMVEIWHPLAKKFAGFLDFQEYPKFAEPGMNNVILYGTYEYIETQSFSIKNKHEARTALERQLGQLEAAEDASPKELADMHWALDDLHDGQIEMGEYHYSLSIFGESLEEVARNLASARAKLQDGPGFKCIFRLKVNAVSSAS